MLPHDDTEYAFVGPLDARIPPFAFDYRAHVVDPARQRPRSVIRQLVLHRVGGPDYPRETEALVPALLSAWGTACPYWAFVEHDGRTVVVSDLVDVGAHAAAWNQPGLGIGVVGDFRVEDPTDVQLDAVVDVLVWACRTLDLEASAIDGHTNLPRSTRWPSKRCPGPRFPLKRVIGDVAAALKGSPAA